MFCINQKFCIFVSRLRDKPTQQNFLVMARSIFHYVVFDGTSYFVCPEMDLNIVDEFGKTPKVINKFTNIADAEDEAERLNEGV